MTSISKGENIVNAFKVVIETYENVDKLMSYLKSQAVEKKEFICHTDKFLRWRTDNAPDGWLYTDFILVFQDMNDKKLRKRWRDGPLYVFNVDFMTGDKEPIVYIARYDYEKISEWKWDVISPADHGFFADPLIDSSGIMEYEYTNGGEEYVGKIKNKNNPKYKGLKSIQGIEVPLMDIDGQEKAYEIVFGGFKKLAEKGELRMQEQV